MKEKTKNLTLQITKKNFDLILSGKQKKETREILPTTQTRYINSYEDGTMGIRVYDTMTLINGRRKEAPRLMVEILDEEMIWIVYEGTDELVLYEYKGEMYETCYIEYILGDVLSHKNTEV